VGRQVAEGTPIKITDRDYVKSMVIQPYHCEFQYYSWLKTER